MTDLERLGLGLRVGGPEWIAMGRNRHIEIVQRELGRYTSGDFNAEGVIIRFSLEAEGSLISGFGSMKPRNYYSSHHSFASCTFKISRLEALYPDEKFKLMLAEKFTASSKHFAPFVKRKHPEFDDASFLEAVEQAMRRYLETPVSTELHSSERESLDIIKVIEREGDQAIDQLLKDQRKKKPSQ